MGLMDAWDYVVDSLSGFWDGVGETFENLGQFSTYGLIFGVIGVAVILLTHQWMLGSFTKLMKPGSAVLTTVLTYLTTFIAGYVLGSRFENT